MSSTNEISTLVNESRKSKCFLSFSLSHHGKNNFPNENKEAKAWQERQNSLNWEFIRSITWPVPFRVSYHLIQLRGEWKLSVETVHKTSNRVVCLIVYPLLPLPFNAFASSSSANFPSPARRHRNHLLSLINRSRSRN